MDRLPFTGVVSATNAFAVSDDAKRAYLHDPKADVVVSIDLEKGNKRFLKWDDKNFAHRRWVCYSLFALTKDSKDYISILFFNQHKKVFCLVHFMITGELLVKVQTNALNTANINKERLAYSVSKNKGDLEIIFYERFSTSASSPAFSLPPARLNFLLCSFSPSTMRVTTTSGILPATGQWELPFISNHSLHFICTSSTPHLFISYPRSEPSSWSVSSPHSVGIMAHDDGYPPRKAQWCNAWSSGVGWFSVTEKLESDDGSIVRKMSLWKLDIDSEWRWRKHPATLDAPETIRSIALRLTPQQPGSPSSLAFLHAEWQYGEAAMFRVKIEGAMGPFRTSSRPLSDARMELNESTSSNDSDFDNEDGLVLRRSMHRGRYANRTPPREHLADLQCPICLDTYEDARTLNCGHSMCWECIEQMRISVKNETIRCPNCRAPTTIPPGGLPINYGLKDAIAALSRLVITRRGCMRCTGCRDKTETDKLWLCITCYRAAEHPSLISPPPPSLPPPLLPRPTSLYLPSSSLPSSSSSSDSAHHPNQSLPSPGGAPGGPEERRKSCGGVELSASTTRSLSTSHLKDDSVVSGTAQAGPSSDCKLSSHAFCAACLLNDHSGHEYEGWIKIRERISSFARRREDYSRRAEATVAQIRERLRERIEECVCAPLQQQALSKLDALTDVIAAADAEEVDRRSEAVLSKLQSICDRFLNESGPIITDLIESCKSDLPCSPRSSIRPRSRTSHATQL